MELPVASCQLPVANGGSLLATGYCLLPAVYWLLAASVLAQTAPSGALPPILPVQWPLPEQISAYGRARLQAERLVMAQEFAANAALDPALVQRVVDGMNSGPADTVADNLLRFGRALAQLEPRFKPGFEHFLAGRFNEAAAALAPLMEEKVRLIKQRRQHNTMPPMAYTLTKLLWAECIGRQGNTVDCVIGYQICWEKLPDSFSFCAMARMRAALIYENSARSHWALAIYKEILQKYGPMLSDAENLRLASKITAMANADPYRVAARASHQVAMRLSRHETGQVTQLQQGNLLELLHAMMAMAEVEDRPFLESTQTIVEGAKTGKLEAGTIDKKIVLAVEDPAKGGSDDWGQLRPREKQQLLQTFNETYPERYRQMIEAYYRNMAQAQSEGR